MSYKSCLIRVATGLRLENLCEGQNLNLKDFGGGKPNDIMYTLHRLKFCQVGQVCDLGICPPCPLNGTLSIYVRYTLACVQTYMHSLSSDIIDIIGIYSNMYSINVHDMQFPIPEFSMETLLLCSLHCTSTAFVFFTRDLIKIYIQYTLYDDTNIHYVSYKYTLCVLQIVCRGLYTSACAQALKQSFF